MNPSSTSHITKVFNYDGNNVEVVNHIRG